MHESKKYTDEEAHKRFAVNCFNHIWSLLEKSSRTKGEDQTMIHLAHASHYHWLQVGEPINEQRGEWMLARVYTVLSDKEKALKHADNCLVLTKQFRFKGFDLGYAHECVARAVALNGNQENALNHKKLAIKAGELIVDQEDKKIFFADLISGPWFGMEVTNYQ